MRYIPIMKSAKQEVLDVLGRLPDDVPMDTVLAELQFKAMLIRGLEEVRHGEVMSHEEVKSRLNKWLESFGRTRLSGT